MCIRDRPGTEPTDRVQGCSAQGAAAGQTTRSRRSATGSPPAETGVMITPARGFTLLELLVALAVFAIMSIAAYSGLSNVLFTRAAVETENRRLAMTQLAFHRLGQDLEQVIPRSVRDEYGEPEPALRGNIQDSEALLFTRAGWDNPLGQPLSLIHI